MALRRIPSRANRPLTLPAPASRLVDQVLACHSDWRVDAEAVEAAYGSWSSAPRRERAARYAAYTAALDQEQCSADSYARMVNHVERLLRVPVRGYARRS